jgi:hypothetical protein
MRPRRIVAGQVRVRRRCRILVHQGETRSVIVMRERHADPDACRGQPIDWQDNCKHEGEKPTLDFC